MTEHTCFSAHRVFRGFKVCSMSCSRGSNKGFAICRGRFVGGESQSTILTKLHP